MAQCDCLPLSNHTQTVSAFPKDRLGLLPAKVSERFVVKFAMAGSSFGGFNSLCAPRLTKVSLEMLNPNFFRFSLPPPLGIDIRRFAALVVASHKTAND